MQSNIYLPLLIIIIILIRTPPPPHLSTPFYHSFDLAVVGLGFHHFDDPGLAATRLVERLKPGGVLMIVDFLPHGHFHGTSHNHGKESESDATDNHHYHHHHHHDSSAATGSENPSSTATEEKEDIKPYPAAHTVIHMGFSSDQVKEIFTKAGAGKDFSYVTVGKGLVFEAKSEGGEGMKRSVFFARGTKA